MVDQDDTTTMAFDHLLRTVNNSKHRPYELKRRKNLPKIRMSLLERTKKKEGKDDDTVPLIVEEDHMLPKGVKTVIDTDTSHAQHDM